jgi:DNA replication protein DnaC
METNMLLDTHLKALRLPEFLQNYAKLAEEAAQADHSYDRFLLALAELEVAQRERNRIARRIKGARFPVMKELADFDFSCISSPNKQRVLELARGGYIQKVEPILLVGNPGLGKTHVATALGLAACRQGHRVRFYNAAGLVNELILAQEENRLPKLLATVLRHRLIILDELGFIPFSAAGSHLIGRMQNLGGRQDEILKVWYPFWTSDQVPERRTFSNVVSQREYTPNGWYLASVACCR